jgi:hypothetical protein
MILSSSNNDKLTHYEQRPFTYAAFVDDMAASQSHGTGMSGLTTRNGNTDMQVNK